jgi:hypothetical protein
LHHGREGHPEESEVHSKYETDMLDRFAPEIIVGINENLKGQKAKADFKGGKDAALSVINLMGSTVKKLPPIEVIEAYNEKDGKERLPHMFSVLGKRTTVVMADGCLRLAAIWASAWKEGGGSKIAASKLGPVNRDELKALYDTKEFLQAFRLQDPKFVTALGD